MKVLEFRKLRKNSLLGFAKIQTPSGMILHHVTVLTGERGPWVSLPGRPMLDRDGVALKDVNGKIRYSPIIEFTSKDVRDKFSRAVVDALRATHPEALEDAR